MATVIDPAHTDLDLTGVYERAAKGEDIVLSRGEGRPRLKLVPIEEAVLSVGKRQLGGYGGRVKEAPGVWDPMSDDELREIGLL